MRVRWCVCVCLFLRVFLRVQVRHFAIVTLMALMGKQTACANSIPLGWVLIDTRMASGARGIFSTPASVPGVEDFAGHVSHAADYRDPESFQGVKARGRQGDCCKECMLFRFPFKSTPKRVPSKDTPKSPTDFLIGHSQATEKGYQRVQLGASRWAM